MFDIRHLRNTFFSIFAKASVQFYFCLDAEKQEKQSGEASGVLLSAQSPSRPSRMRLHSGLVGVQGRQRGWTFSMTSHL